MAWRNQSAERAHPLRSEIAALGLERRKQRGERIANGSELFANTSAETTKVGFHLSTLAFSSEGVGCRATGAAEAFSEPFGS